MGQVEDRIAAKGLVLPPPLLLPEGMVLPFPEVNVRGQRAVISGASAVPPDGTVSGPFGKVGADVTVDEAHHLTANPRTGTWRSVLAHLKEHLNDSFVADKSALSEELNRAWGGHEITSDYFPDALSYLEGDVL